MKNLETIETTKLVEMARQYDATNNEGGEGYNPYAAEIDNRQAECLGDRRGGLARELGRIDCSIARESGTYDADRVAVVKAEIAEIDAAESAAFAAEWTVAVTEQRRSEWANRVRSGEFGQLGSGKTDWSAVNKAQRGQGWTVGDLKRAVAASK